MISRKGRSGWQTSSRCTIGAIQCLLEQGWSRRRIARELGVDRETAVQDARGNLVTYLYDAAGNRATLVDPDGGVSTYSYDGRNLLSWLVNPLAERTTWVYDALGRVTTMTHANATTAEHDYDAAGRACRRPALAL